ncbi:cytochrome P450, partial [Actinosynnema sp. NPDC059797]
ARVRDPRRALAAVARSEGGVVELHPGTWLVTDPATTERLLASRHAVTARTARGAAASWGEGGLERWMAARRAVRPELTEAAAARFAPITASSARHAVTRWASAARVDAMAEATRLMSALNTHYVLGEPAPSLTALVEDELSTARRAFRPASLRLPRKQLATRSALHAHLRAAAPGRGLVAALTGAGLDERSTAQAVRTMLLSGHHVPAAALAWALHELSARPDLQRRIRDEATARPDPRAADLPLCRAVVRETLRLHPPIWQLRRVLDAPVPGFPAGAEVLFSPYVNHRDPAAHPDPDRFDPHRWTTAPRPSPGSYLPFALGPRFCPGSHLATAELAVVLAAVLERHHVAPYRAPKPSRGVLNAPRRLRLTLVPHDRR